jgi:hypothetical protein
MYEKSWKGSEDEERKSGVEEKKRLVEKLYK